MRIPAAHDDGYDFFVSFAHDDNQHHPTAPMGWVSNLYEALLIELKRTRYGRAHGVRGFFAERHMDGTVALDDQIYGILPKTRLLVVVLSDSYLGSQWCRDERTAFLAAVRNQSHARQRVVMIDLGSVAPHEKPGELAALLGVPFFGEKNGRVRTYGYPYPLATNPDDRPFFDAVSDVARKMAERLDELRASEPARAPTAPAGKTAVSTAVAPLQPVGANTLISSPVPPRGVVYLAEATDDQYQTRERIAADLAQHGVLVLPRETLSSDAAACRGEIEGDLAQAQQFVQVLGAFDGRRLRGSEESAVRLQHRLARERGLPVHVWRPAGVDPQQTPAGEYHNLLADPEVRTGTLEQFQAEVRELFAPPKPVVVEEDAAPRDAAAGRRRPLVLVTNDVKDEQEADRLCRLLKSDLKFRTKFCRPEDDPAEEAQRRELFNELLLECDGLVLLYGQVKPLWIEQQEAALWKLNARRKQPVRVAAVYVGPPQDREMYEPDDPEIVAIDCRAGVAPEKLRAALKPLADEVGP